MAAIVLRRRRREERAPEHAAYVVETVDARASIGCASNFSARQHVEPEPSGEAQRTAHSRGAVVQQARREQRQQRLPLRLFANVAARVALAPSS